MSIRYMENTTHCNPQTAEEQIKSFIDFVDALPMFSPAFRAELKILFTELMPSVRERNREHIHNLIDVKRDLIVGKIESDVTISHELKEHRKNGARLYADALKWMLDGMMFV